jgi:LysM repeat protein
MKQFKRLSFYILLNILVSACTTFSVLWVWDQYRSPLPKGVIADALQALSHTATPTLASPEDTPVPQPTPTETFIVHQVEAGETFESLAEQYNMSVEELVAVNGFSGVQPLGAGEVLRIPVHPKGTVLIDSVIGAGDLATERVLLKHRGEGELSLVGWRLESNNGDLYIFPQFPQMTLFGGGAVNVYTKAGVDTVVDLYWGSDSPLWFSGASVTLKDVQGNVRDTYTVP